MQKKILMVGKKTLPTCVQLLCTNTTDSSQCNVKCIEKLLGKLHAAPAVVVPPIIITLQFAVTL